MNSISQVKIFLSIGHHFFQSDIISQLLIEPICFYARTGVIISMHRSVERDISVIFVIKDSYGRNIARIVVQNEQPSIYEIWLQAVIWNSINLDSQKPESKEAG